MNETGHMILSEGGLETARNNVVLLQKAALEARRKLVGAHPKRITLVMQLYADQIEELNTEIVKYVTRVEGVRPRAELEVKLDGPEVGYGEILLSYLTKYLSEFQSVIRYVAKGLKGDWFVPIDKYIENFRKLTSVWMLAPQPGSFKLAFKFEPQKYKGDLFAKKVPLPRAALKTIVDIAHRAIEEKAENLDDLLPDKRKQRKVLRFIRDFSPSKGLGINKVEWIPLTIDYKEPIRLYTKTRSYLDGLLIKPGAVRRTVSGELDGFDHINKLFKITPKDGKRISCRFPEHLEGAVLRYIMQRVKVTGEAKFVEGTDEVSKITDVHEIESLEEKPT